MKFYFHEPFKELVPLYRVLSEKEFNLVKGHGFKAFPERFFGKAYSTYHYSLKDALRSIINEQDKIKEGDKLYIINVLFLTKHIKSLSVNKEPRVVLIPPEWCKTFNEKIIGLISVETVVDMT